MKELYRSKGVVLLVDDDQWIVADAAITPEISEKTGKANVGAGSEIFKRQRYYTRLEYALKAVCERVSRREARNLAEYLLKYGLIKDELVRAVKR